MRFLLALTVLVRTALAALTYPNATLTTFTPRDVVDACGSIAITVTKTETALDPVTQLPIVQTVQVSAGFCVCVHLGQFTLDTQSRISDMLQTGPVATLLAPLYTSLPTWGLQDVIDYINTHSPSLVLQDTCQRPAHSIPSTDSSATCSACDYTCDTSNGYQPCGQSCYDPNTQTCQSGVPVNNMRKRSARRGRNNVDLRCASGHTACEIPNLTSNSAVNKLECIDTRSNVESCGGCMYPGPNQLEGEDCTAIPNVANVQCVAGSCVVKSCARGFMLSAGECVSRKSDLGELLGSVLANKLVKQGVKNEFIFGSPAKRRLQPRTADKKRKLVV